MQKNDVYRHRDRSQDIQITLLEPKGSNWKFKSETHGVVGMWSTKHIEREFEVLKTEEVNGQA